MTGRAMGDGKLDAMTFAAVELFAEYGVENLHGAP